MNIVAQLPESVSPDEPRLRLWDGDLSSVPELLDERKKQVARNWFSTATFPDAHPYARKIRKECKQLSNVLVQREAVNQVEFLARLRNEYGDQMLHAENQSPWDRPRNIAKVTDRWANVVPLLEGV